MHRGEGYLSVYFVITIKTLQIEEYAQIYKEKKVKPIDFLQQTILLNAWIKEIIIDNAASFY